MKIKVWVSTDRVGSKMTRTLKIDDEDLKGMSASERLSYLDECARDEVFNMIEHGWAEE